MWCNPHMLLRNQLVQLIRDRWVSDICAANLTVTISDENVLRTNGKGGTPVDIASTIRRSRTTDSPHAKPAQQCLVTSIFFEDSSPCYSATWRGIVTHNLSTLEHTRQWTSPLRKSSTTDSPHAKTAQQYLVTSIFFEDSSPCYSAIWRGIVTHKLSTLGYTHQWISPLRTTTTRQRDCISSHQLPLISPQITADCLSTSRSWSSSQHCDFTPSDHQLPFQLHLTSSIQSHSVVK